MQFKIFSTDPKSAARAGEITTDHGAIRTPIFMPVGTAGSVKGLHIQDVKEDVKAEIILGNTYHLYLRPGLDGPILTDSGGYQVYSLAERRKLTKEGVVFQSHIDGSKHNFTPERVMDIERTIGADIMMAFDECTPFPCDYQYAASSLQITHHWLDRCIDRFINTPPVYGYQQSLFPIVQGSTYKELRVKSAEYIASKGADGNAIGGLSVGEPVEEMYEMTDLVCRILPFDKPRYLMGVGTPANILESIALGVDMFDCVMPTRNGRNGMLFTSEGIINIKNEKWKADFSPLDINGVSLVDSQYTKAYLRHLIISKEILGAMIASQHNLAFYLWLVRQAREHIVAGDFTTWKNQMVTQVTNRL